MREKRFPGWATCFTGTAASTPRALLVEREQAGEDRVVAESYRPTSDLEWIVCTLFLRSGSP